MVDTDFFSPPTTPPDSTGFTILSIGWLVHRKRMDILLRAFAQSFVGRDHIRLEIGGSGPELAALRELASRLGIAGQVSFLGALGRDDVRYHMRRANLFVLPSSYETFGVVLIEAMATGLPVVATSSGGPKEIVNEKVGRLVLPDNVSELANAMDEEYRLREWRLQQRFDIAREAEERYSKHVVVEMLEHFYASALGGERDR
jgi:glycosyltransferase involved in cell wall biosynthesis